MAFVFSGGIYIYLWIVKSMCMLFLKLHSVVDKTFLQNLKTLPLLNNPPILLLYGGQRLGKTLALKYLPKKLIKNKAGFDLKLGRVWLTVGEKG